MTATTITRRSELAHRSGDGNCDTARRLVPEQIDVDAVADVRAGDGFELEVDGRHALDAFNHPYAYAARTDTPGIGVPTDGLVAAWCDADGDSQEAINPGRADHAGTDR
jgi:hypothetical protein